VYRNVKILFHKVKIICVENRTVFESVEKAMEQSKRVFYFLHDFGRSFFCCDCSSFTLTQGLDKYDLVFLTRYQTLIPFHCSKTQVVQENTCPKKVAWLMFFVAFVPPWQKQHQLLSKTLTFLFRYGSNR